MYLSLRHLIFFCCVVYADSAFELDHESPSSFAYRLAKECSWSFRASPTASKILKVKKHFSGCDDALSFLQSQGFVLEDGALHHKETRGTAFYIPEYLSVSSIKKQLKSYFSSKVFKSIGFFEDSDMMLINLDQDELVRTLDHASPQVHVRAVLWISDQHIHQHEGLSAPLVAHASFEEWLRHLQELEAQGRVELLAQPELYVSAHKKAVVSSGEELPYSSYEGKKKSVLFKKAFLSLKVHASHIGSSGANLDVEISVDKAGEHWYQGHIGIARQHIKTTLRVPFQETRLLGGVQQYRNSTQHTCIPVASWLPVLGRMFCDRSEKKHHSVLYALLSVEPF